VVGGVPVVSQECTASGFEEEEEEEEKKFRCYCLKHIINRLKSTKSLFDAQ